MINFLWFVRCWFRSQKVSKDHIKGNILDIIYDYPGWTCYQIRKELFEYGYWISATTFILYLTELIKEGKIDFKTEVMNSECKYYQNKDWRK